jgi:acyl phosphate:glycerol-3-phosphate acyltransferase
VIFNLLLLVAAFLLGSVPFGLLMARAFHVNDLQAKGSGNIGATNVSRVVGFWPAGALTFLLDVLKGAVPVLVMSLPATQRWWTAWLDSLGHPGVEITENVIWAVGLAAILGHCFSPWVRFKGGKGVATGFGVIVVLTPWAGLAGILAFAFAFLKTRTASLASITGLVTVAIVHLTIHDHHAYGSNLWIGAAMLFLILARHESNLDGLLRGQERAFK